MAEVIVNEKVSNKQGESGTITAFDGRYIIVEFSTQSIKYRADAFEKGFLRYESAGAQAAIDDRISEEKQKEEAKRKAAETAADARRRVQAELSRTHFNVAVLSAVFRLDPAPITLGAVRKKDQDIVKAVFAECDKETEELYNSIRPDMSYLRHGSHQRSKYCAAFLCQYLDTYVLRVFSRNDAYSRTAQGAVTIQESDATEVLRVLQVNGKTYYFSKNLIPGGDSLVNTKAHKSWHVSNLDTHLILDQVIRLCDCKYLNDAVACENVDCLPYAKLLILALCNNKAEIVFKHKLFNEAYRIENFQAYLEEYTSKQIDFACKNKVLNSLPVIKRCGIQDVEILRNMEQIMRKRRSGASIYNSLERYLTRLGEDCTDLIQKLVRFLKKVPRFDAQIYFDYIDEIVDRPDTTADTFFVKDYIDRHDIILREKWIQCSVSEKEAYRQVAASLSWIDREENDYFILVPKTIDEFREEGQMQHNCVYTNRYYRDVIKKESIIVFLRRNKAISYVTIEYDYETFDVWQARTKRNDPVDPELYQYIVDLGQRLRYEMYSQQ